MLYKWNHITCILNLRFSLNICIVRSLLIHVAVVHFTYFPVLYVSIWQFIHSCMDVHFIEEFPAVDYIGRFLF